MARIDSLFCPFTSKVHSDASLVHEGSVGWAKSLGLLPTEQHSRTAYKAKVGWLVARAFPTAIADGLQLAADWTVLFCILDDYIEKLETADEVEAYLEHLLNLLRADISGSPDDPFALAMMDLRQRLLAMAPVSFVASFADRLEELFAGNVAEARHREQSRILDVASYVQLRQVTIGLQVMFVLAELVEGLCLSDDTREHPALKQLAARTTNIVAWANDLFTYEKEILQGEVHNLVLVMMNERRLTIAEAVTEVAAIHDSEVYNFLKEVEQLPSLGLADASVHRYVDMLSCWIRGHLDWAHEPGRYRPFDEPAVEPTRSPASWSVAA